MTDCTISESPYRLADRTLTLYYNSSGECELADTTAVSEVYAETNYPVVITFMPLTGASTPYLYLARYCGSGNSGAYTKTDLNPPGDGSIFTITFLNTSTGLAVWGWDFEGEDRPPPLTVKVRVKRI